MMSDIERVPLDRYHCLKCGNDWQDSPQREPYNCPQCGSYQVTFTRGR